ncbi:MAG: FKBP-type peptidyl-prolyl cis-trans isomerase [Planctomycetota bacterium]|jgi:FKBP-type peptidyl-prolyl cis-trans isomerase
MVLPMQNKSIGILGAACALIAVLASCGVGQAEPGTELSSADEPSPNMSSTIQDGDIPAPADVAAPPADALTTASGLAYKVITAGDGTLHPASVDEVTVHYTGWTTDGKMFDSSVKGGTPSSFGLNGVIAGWTEGLQLMVAGETTRFWIPEALAYGGRPGSPAGMLVFDVQLISIQAKPKPPEVPADLNEAPADATTTESGLKIKTLTAGTGTVHPTASDKVTVHYSGWTLDGKMFDSSVMRGEPASFALGAVIAGWTEGLQHMVVGEKARLWIPEALAYAGQPGSPAGVLVFDVELLEVTTGPKTPENLTTPPEDAMRTESGLVIQTLKQGDTSATTSAATVVLINFSFWDETGKMFQSTVLDGAPAPMEVAGTSIKGLAECLTLLHVGQTARVWIPKELAFGDQPGAPQGTVVFDIEVLKAFTAPADLQAAPEGATTTESGLAYIALSKGPDQESASPSVTSTVTMHFSGWQETGTMVDSSYFRGPAETYPVSAVMPGWTEGLQLMKSGDTFRFWVPASLGFGTRPGAPGGDLVFDIELISFE